jgi:hypothetical protein
VRDTIPTLLFLRDYNILIKLRGTQNWEGSLLCSFLCPGTPLMFEDSPKFPVLRHSQHTLLPSTIWNQIFNVFMCYLIYVLVTTVLDRKREDKKIEMIHRYKHKIHLRYVISRQPIAVVRRSKRWKIFSRILGSWVRIPLEAWMSVYVHSICDVLYIGSGLATG